MTSVINSKYTILDRLLQSNCRFAIYRVATSSTLHFILQTNYQTNIYSDFSDLYTTQGFVLSPFHISKESPIISISPDIRLNGEKNIFDFLDSFCLDHTPLPKLSYPRDKGLDNYLKYQEVFNQFHNEIEKKDVDKLVLSRTKDITINKSTSIGLLFEKAKNKYPNNFVYLCNTPETGTWLGCSPEILLAGKNFFWTTHALAGTQKITNKEKIIWDSKNLSEQSVVFNYIKKNLKNLGIEAIVNEKPTTIVSGELAHLRSEFTFNNHNVNKICKVLEILHPTPAVCGYPKDMAFNIIRKKEGYDRSYYSGFIGPFNLDKGYANLYVNLRCMQIFTNSIRLYAGGGIMPQSQVENEWLETEYKLQTIASIL